MDYLFWVVLFVGGPVLILMLFHGGKRGENEWDKANEDMEQEAAVTKPAALEAKPHRRAGTGWMGD